MTIRAVIFDLDGTLVQTERLKANSYALAVRELCESKVEEKEVLEAYKDLVGLSRQEVAQGLISAFHLEITARERMPLYGVSTPWQAFVQMRLKYYEDMLQDTKMITENIWPHNVALLAEVRKAGCKVGLATMSYCAQVNRILMVLNLDKSFDFVASRDDVENGKPDPEIYKLVASQLGVSAEDCLVIEDSPSGVKSAIAAGMKVIAVTTPFTMGSFRQQKLLENEWIVNDPETLPQVVKKIMMG